MGLLDALAGRQKEISKEDVQEELKPILLDSETVGAAFKVMRDMLVFTDRRLISIDKQGVTGKKVEYRSIPYSSITIFSKESAGVLDWDAELKIWVRGMADPLEFSFNKDAPINDVYQLLSEKLLG